MRPRQFLDFSYIRNLPVASALPMMRTMAFRLHERMLLRLPVTVSGVGQDGSIFVEHARTLDISPMGARLTGIRHSAEPGSMLAVQQGVASGRFRVIWKGEPYSNREGQIGVACVEVGQASMVTLLYIGNGDMGTDRHRRTLHAAGYKVHCASPKEGLELAQGQAYDAILLEHPLGNINVDELMSCLRAYQPKASMLILSTQPGALVESAGLRTYALLHKGTTARELLVRVEELVGASTQLKWPITRSVNRYGITTEVRVRLVRAGVARLFSGRSTDLSECGVSAILLGAEMEPGELVSVSFTLPLAGDVYAYGTVRHRGGQQYGIELADLEPRCRQAIRSMCQVLPPLNTPHP